VILSVHRLSGAILHSDLSTTHSCIANTSQRWKQTWHNDLLSLWSDEIFYRAAGTCELQEVTFVVSYACCNEDTWPLDVVLDGPERWQISPARIVRLCDWTESLIQVTNKCCQKLSLNDVGGIF